MPTIETVARHMRIKAIRKRLARLSKIYPLTHPLMLGLSRRLDKLILVEQREMCV
jgi:hypothetical protein